MTCFVPALYLKPCQSNNDQNHMLLAATAPSISFCALELLDGFLLLAELRTQCLLISAMALPPASSTFSLRKEQAIPMVRKLRPAWAWLGPSTNSCAQNYEFGDGCTLLKFSNAPGTTGSYVCCSRGNTFDFGVEWINRYEIDAPHTAMIYILLHMNTHPFSPRWYTNNLELALT